MNIESAIHQMGKQARAASYQLAQLSTEEKNNILRCMAQRIRDRKTEIIAANQLDLEAGITRGLSAAMLDRLKLDDARVEAMASGIEQVATLEDPVGQILAKWKHPKGIEMEQVRVPIGTIAIIYESRPNVTADAAVLCFKTGNATILRGGSEAIHSNQIIAAILNDAGAPAHAIQMIPFTDRESVKVLAQMDQWLDLIIPRGGKGLIETVVSLARMPVIKHYDGICHMYVEASANLNMASLLVLDAKTQKPGVCNALETLLVDASIAATFLPQITTILRTKNVEIRACAQSLQWIPDAIPASEQDWHTEYLDLIISIKIVDGLDQAIAHINHYGSHHTDSIITENKLSADLFLKSVDSACVFHNISTRFADGGEFGFGAEIGISTDKLHARGPMGLRELTSYQYRARGNGQTKADYAKP